MSGGDILKAKLTAMAVLGLASLLLGLLPIKLSQWLGWGRNQYRKGQSEQAKAESGGAGGDVLSCILCAGAGVLLCTTLVHLLPAVQQASEKFTAGLHRPLNEACAELLMCAGFFLMYLVEELVHVVLHRRHHGKRSVAPVTIGQVAGQADTPALGDAKVSPIQSLRWGSQEQSKTNVELHYADGSTIITEVPSNFKPTFVSFSDVWGAGSSAGKNVLRVDIEHPASHGLIVVPTASSKCHKVHHDHSAPDAETSTLPSFMSAAKHHSHVMPIATHGTSVVPTGLPGHSAVTAKISAPEEPVAAIRGLLIVMALSVHELFEGLAIGLEDKASHVWYLMAAVACHKLVIAFCIGVELVSMKTRTILVILYVSTFAIVSPIGIAIGVCVSIGNSSEDSSVALILQGLACGTLLYVIFFEILERQRACGNRGLRQLASVFVGFIAMLGLAFFGDGHDHHKKG